MDNKTVLWTSRFLGVHIVTLLFIILRRENFEQAAFRFVFVTLFTAIVFFIFDYTMAQGL
jgi:hypothetical protein